MKILLVEDEPGLAIALKAGLERSGFAVDAVSDGGKGLTRLSLNRADYDAVILDLMLPTMDGFELCKKARAEGIAIPMIVLTARSETDMKVKMLGAGADDYLVKPFALVELAARLHALLRRPSEKIPEVLSLRGITLDPSTRKVTRDGDEVSLTLKEFGLLEFLMRHPGKVVNREDLLSHLWDFDYDGFSNVVDVHMKNLRRKLGGREGGLIETVRGVGYRFRT